MALTPAHWIYLTGIVVIILVVIAKKNVVIPAVIATLATALAFTGGDLLRSISAVFNATLVAATELFTIFLTIALVTALLGSLQALGADRKMVQPFQGLMRNGRVSFMVVAAVTFVISLFLWPTPALPLVGAVLVPAAIRAGLTPFCCAIAIAIAGQGMALSSDYIMGVAPSLAAEGANVPANIIADRALILSVIVGLVALAITYVRDVRTTVRTPSPAHLRVWLATAKCSDAATLEEESASLPQSVPASVSAQTAHPAKHAVTTQSRPAVVGDGGGSAGHDRSDLNPGAGEDTAGTPIGRDYPGAVRQQRRHSRLFAVLVPASFGTLLACMLLGKFTSLLPQLAGSKGASLVGGTALLLLVLATVIHDRRNSLEDCATHVVDGLVFAFRAMGVVVPIAGFIFIGIPDFAGRILGIPEGEKVPGFLFDAIRSVEDYIPNNSVVVIFATLIMAMIIGLDGNGWAGLPLMGSIASALGPPAGVAPATLAATAQVSATWTGGGTLVIWSSLIAVAGITRVSVVDLARRLFIPVVSGLIVSAIFASLFW